MAHLSPAAATRNNTDSVCNRICGNVNDCIPSLSCSACVHYKCGQGAQCGGKCSLNLECDQAGNCTACDITGVCVPHCGQFCNNDTDCINFGCHQCVSHGCQRWKCGLPCKVPGDCCSDTTSACTFCSGAKNDTLGTCRSPCGAPCWYDADCPSRCPYCFNRTCVNYRPSPNQPLNAPQSQP